MKEGVLKLGCSGGGAQEGVLKREGLKGDIKGNIKGDFNRDLKRDFLKL